MEKRRILDEFCAVTRYHRKAAIRVLKAGSALWKTCPPWKGAGDGPAAESY
jgi:hypothetical protein